LNNRGAGIEGGDWRADCHGRFADFESTKERKRRVAELVILIIKRWAASRNARRQAAAS